MQTFEEPHAAREPQFGHPCYKGKPRDLKKPQLAKQQLAFRSNDESSNSSNRRDYVELLRILSEKDEKLARHL